MRDVFSTNYGVRLFLGGIVFLVLIVLLFISLICAKSKGFSRRKVIIIFIPFFIIMFYVFLSFPFEKVLGFSRVEDAYKFQFPEGKFSYKKIYKNTAFVYGTNVYDEKDNSGNSTFTYYVMKNNKWISGESPEKTLLNQKKLRGKNGSYNLYKFYNRRDDVTGIFVQGVFPKDQFDEETEIIDSKGNEFEINKGFSNVWDGEDIYFALGIVNGKVDDDYYILIDGAKLVDDGWL